MKRSITAFLTLALLTLLLPMCGDQSTDPSAKADGSAETVDAQIAHGEYLVKITGCAHCHTPKKMTANGPVPDADRWLMGYPNGDPLPAIDTSDVGPGKWVLFHGDLTAAVGPWGISFGSNLTPHETGIGNWTFEHFKRAMTEGKHKGLENGRPIMPPMPWQAFREMKEADLEAMYAYLMSVEPIENIVPSYVPPNAIDQVR